MRIPASRPLRFTFRPELFEDGAGRMDYDLITEILEAARDHDLREVARRRRQMTLTPELFARVEVEARRRGVHPETLVNLWIHERLDDVQSD